MRLVVIITGLSIGGAEMMLLKVLECIDRSRFSPHVISLTKQGEIGPRIEALGIPSEAMHMVPARPSTRKFMKLVTRLQVLRPDVVHTWMYHADLLGGLAARLAGVQVIGWGIHHSNLSPEHNKRSTLWVMKACALLSSRVPRQIMCCSEAARKVHEKAGYARDKLVVVPNGFDLSRFKPDQNVRAAVREELGLPVETPLVGMIARYDPQKNHVGFFRAAALVHQHRPDVHFLLAGTGVDSANAGLIYAMGAASVAKVTHLLGRREDVPRLMVALDILASASVGEAFPNVLGEAMACGVACVVTDVGDSAEIIGDTGRVVAAGDMTGLAESILEILALPIEERIHLGEKARGRVKERYEIGNVVRRYEAFYESLLSGNPVCAG